MSDFNHSAGDWVITKISEVRITKRVRISIASRFGDVTNTSVNAHVFGNNEEDAQANARLVKESPNLLMELRRCVDRLEENGFEDTNAVKKAKEVIERVRG